MSKPTIIFCDDQRRFREQFLKDHGGDYNITVIDDTRNLLETIDGLKELPNIILLDLYYPRRGNDSDFEERRRIAEQKLSELDEKLEETNRFVLNAWEPDGIEMLRAVREKYSRNQISVAIYTRKGLVLLEDDQLRRVEELEGHWLLKEKLSSRTEKVRINRIIKNDQDIKRLQDDEKIVTIYRLILAFSWLIIGLLVSHLIFDWSTFMGIAVSVVTAFLTGLVAFVLSALLKTKDQNVKL